MIEDANQTLGDGPIEKYAIQMVTLFREMIARFEGMPDGEGRG